MTRSAITHMRQTGPRDIAARMGVVRAGARDFDDVRAADRATYRADRAVTIAAIIDAMRRRRAH